METVKIGVLALQGAFELHRPHIEGLGAQYVEVVAARDLVELDALILPGGESGVMLKLIEATKLWQPLKEFMKVKPCWGICAGAILMASKVFNPSQACFETMDIEIERNAYGRQIDSFHDFVNDYEVSFIRAPQIKKLSKSVTAMSKKNGRPTWVKQGHLMATTFHPETNLKTPSPWHRALLL